MTLKLGTGQRLEDSEEQDGSLEQTVSRNMDFKDTADEDSELRGIQRNMPLETR